MLMTTDIKIGSGERARAGSGSWSLAGKASLHHSRLQQAVPRSPHPAQPQRLGALAAFLPSSSALSAPSAPTTATLHGASCHPPPVADSRSPHSGAPGVAPSGRPRGWHGGPTARGHVACRATLDCQEIAELVEKMVAQRPPAGPRDKLDKCLALIKDINSNDPSKVEFNGSRQPYRLLFGSWLAEWVGRLDPGAPDELVILAWGKNLESWRLSEIKRDDYSPNTGGQKQWEADRKAWLAARLRGVMKEAGYPEPSLKLVEDFMLNRDLPDPRDVRLYDITGPMGMINYRLLELLLMVQTLRDAEVLVFLERTFPRMFEELPADQVLPAVRRELAAASRKCLATALQLPWSELQAKLLARALPTPPGWGAVLREVEGVAAASTHPGDWRFRNYDYE